MIRRSSPAVFLAVLSASPICLAQGTRLSPHVSLGYVTGMGQAGYLSALIGQLDAQRLRPLAEGGSESQSLEASLGLSRGQFRAKLAAPDGVYTLETKEGDVLVARWRESDATRPDRGVWLWDTPYTVTFLFEVAPSLLRADELAPFLENTLIWAEDGGSVKELDLAFLESGQVIGSRSREESLAVGLYWWLAATQQRDDAYVAVRMNKAPFRSEFPLGTMHVPERFPPLAERLKALPRESVLREVGRGYRSPFLVTHPENRDEIVIGELVSRGPLSNAEINGVVLGGLDGIPTTARGDANRRLATLLAVLERRHQTKLYLGSLETCFLETAGNSGLSAVTLLGALDRAGIDWLDTALRLLSKDEFFGGSLGLIDRRVRFTRSPEVLRRLAEAPVAPRFREARDRAVELMRKRMQPQPGIAPQ